MQSLVALAATGLLLAGGSAVACSSKHSIRLEKLVLLSEVSSSTPNQTVSGEWEDILHTPLLVSKEKDVVVQVSLHSGLYTDAPARGGRSPEDGTPARAALEVRVLVDGAQADAGDVIFTQLHPYLVTRLGGILDACKDDDADGAITPRECILTEEELRRVRNTLHANSFTYSLEALGPGLHELRVQARVTLSSYAARGSLSVGAWVGQGSVHIEETQLLDGSKPSSPSLSTHTQRSFSFTRGL